MKYALALLLIVFCGTAYGQHRLQLVWETDSVLATPESVLAHDGVLYISLIDGAPWDNDGRGGVGKLSADGKIIDTNWITGLSAPKGMGIKNNSLYVADIGNVTVIDISKGQIGKKIVINGAQGLNDITIADNGTVYVSDSKLGKVWRIVNDEAELFLENMDGVNGLKAVNNDLYVAKGKTFIKAAADKKVTVIAELSQPGDGVEPLSNGDFIVTSWGGFIFYVAKDGKVETLLDSSKEKRNTADIGIDTENNIIYVPTFFAKTVAAYKVL